MNTNKTHGSKLALVGILIGVAVVMAGVENLYADNIVNSRHNLSRLTTTGVVLYEQGGIAQGSNYPVNMAGATVGSSGAYEQYGEVCVYCHTPHGGGEIAPLWNRKYNTSNSYTPYNSSTIDTGVGQPGGVSLACLSCHDGTIAVDNIVNAPGSGGYNTNGRHPNPGPNHMVMAPGNEANKCGSCHKGNGLGYGVLGAHDSTIVYLTTDLRSTHPISMTYPTLTGVDPKFFPPNGQGKFANGVKLYNNKVECPSCHNPHLGEDDYSVTPGLRPFLRTPNEQSQLCTTCHIK